MTKKQITITLDEKDVDFIHSIAEIKFEGNDSMAARYIIRKHRKESK